jgi:hypothetical protein
MITRSKGFLSVFAIAMVFAVACDSESTSVPLSNEAAQTSDCQGCLLRERVASAQPGDTINIAAGVYTMTGGELVIDKDLKLVGAGADNTVIQAAESLDVAVHRVIRITEESIVSIAGVTVRYGSETSTEVRMIPFHSEAIGMPESGIEAMRAEFGGGIFNGGILLGSNLLIEGNAAGGGAGLSNWGEASLVTTTYRCEPFQDQRRRVPQQQHRDHDVGFVNGKQQ